MINKLTLFFDRFKLNNENNYLDYYKILVRSKVLSWVHDRHTGHPFHLAFTLGHSIGNSQLEKSISIGLDCIRSRSLSD